MKEAEKHYKESMAELQKVCDALGVMGYSKPCKAMEHALTGISFAFGSYRKALKDADENFIVEDEKGVVWSQ